MTPPPVTPIRARRGGRIHATADLRRTLCGRPCDGWPVGVEVPTCRICLLHLAART